MGIQIRLTAIYPGHLEFSACYPEKRGFNQTPMVQPVVQQVEDNRNISERGFLA